MRKDVLRQSCLQEDVLDFDAGDKSVLVGVRLAEEGVVAQALSGVHDPGDGLNSGRVNGGRL